MRKAALFSEPENNLTVWATAKEQVVESGIRYWRAGYSSLVAKAGERRLVHVAGTCLLSDWVAGQHFVQYLIRTNTVERLGGFLDITEVDI